MAVAVDVEGEDEIVICEVVSQAPPRIEVRE